MKNITAILMALGEFERIMKEEGEDAAIAWADQMALDITPDTKPKLRLVCRPDGGRDGSGSLL